MALDGIKRASLLEQIARTLVALEDILLEEIEFSLEFAGLVAAGRLFKDLKGHHNLRAVLARVFSVVDVPVLVARIFAFPREVHASHA